MVYGPLADQKALVNTLQSKIFSQAVLPRGSWLASSSTGWGGGFVARGVSARTLARCSAAVRPFASLCSKAGDAGGGPPRRLLAPLEAALSLAALRGSLYRRLVASLHFWH